MTARDIAQAVEGAMSVEFNPVVTGVSIDSRKICKGDLYVAIRGNRQDGHLFAAQAIVDGAVLVLAAQDAELADDIPCVRCQDTVAALGKLAAWHRTRFQIPVVAVTGSVGKTSTREMIAAAMSGRFQVLQTRGNYNNEIGLPLSVLEMDDQHSAAVFELGMSGLGEIGYLSRIVKPDISVITNIGLSHIEKLGSRQNILRAKLEIIEGMSPSGIVILNGEDELLKGLRGLLPYKTLYYGMDEATDVQGYEAASLGENGMAFKTSIAGQEGSFVIRSPGMHSVSNALAALAVCHVLGLRQEEAEEGLIRFAGTAMRMNIQNLHGVRVINDAYNAAPASVKAALSVLVELGTGRRTVAVLGDMMELGDWSREAHLDVGRQAAMLRVGWIIAVGHHARYYLDGAREMGMQREHLLACDNMEEACHALSGLLEAGDTLLLKGSRGMQMESLLDCLFADEKSIGVNQADTLERSQ